MEICQLVGADEALFPPPTQVPGQLSVRILRTKELGGRGVGLWVGRQHFAFRDALEGKEVAIFDDDLAVHGAPYRFFVVWCF